MSWIDGFFAPSYQVIQAAGVPLPVEKALNFLTSTGFSVADNPSNGSTDITNTGGGGGGGGWTVISSSTASHPTLSRAVWQKVWGDSSGGPFTLPLPPAPVSGDLIDFKDIGATSATTGIAAHAITLNGASIEIQDKHTMTISSTSYAWGTASGDGGGDAFSLQFNGSTWMVVE